MVLAPASKILAAILSLLSLSELLWLTTDANWALWLVLISILLTVVFSIPRFGLREWYLVSLCSCLSLAILWIGQKPSTVLWTAIEQAGFLMAFVLLVGLLQQGAETSQVVTRAGLWLTQQRAGRRHASVFLGTHLMSTVFNLGVIAMLSPLIQQGTADKSDPANVVRERRQLVSMLRGFAWGVIWSPTAIAPLTLMTLLPDANRAAWIATGMCIALAIFLTSAAEDHLRWRAPVGTPIPQPPQFPGKEYASLGLLCLILLGLTLGFMTAFDQSVVFGLMAASPIILVGWVYLQKRDVTQSANRLNEVYHTYLPRSAPIAISLGCSGFIGRAAAELTPTQEIVGVLGLETMPGWVFLTLLTTAVTVLSWAALSPIMLAVFFGAIIADIPNLPVDITWAALAISCGWALSMTSSPFATTILMTSQITGHPGARLTALWNWQFSLLALGVLIPAYWLITHL